LGLTGIPSKNLFLHSSSLAGIPSKNIPPTRCAALKFRKAPSLHLGLIDHDK
jgi:hypothetical protein